MDIRKSTCNTCGGPLYLAYHITEVAGWDRHSYCQGEFWHIEYIVEYIVVQ